MSQSVPGPDSLLVGAKNVGTAFDNIRVVTKSLTPTAVSITVSTFEATVTGVNIALDIVTLVAQPTQSALGVVAAMAQAGLTNDHVTIYYTAQSATAATPNSGNYTFLIYRKAIY